MTTPHLAGHPAASQQAIVDAALLMLQQVGLSPNDLVTAPHDRPPVPTFAEYVPVDRVGVLDSVMRPRSDRGGRAARSGPRAASARAPRCGMVVLDPGEVLEDLVIWTARTAQERDRGPGPSRPGRAATRQ